MHKNVKYYHLYLKQNKKYTTLSKNKPPQTPKSLYNETPLCESNDNIYPLYYLARIVSWLKLLKDK